MLNTPDALYGQLLADLLNKGLEVKTRNSVCKRLFAEKLTFTTTPLIAARKTAWKSALREFEWFLSGSNKLEDLHPSVHPWWQPWVNKDGVIPNNYSEQFRHFCGVEQSEFDQIGYLVKGIEHHPFSRRNVISTWNTADMVHENTPISNCHGTIIQCFVNPDNTLHLVMYQRSVDTVCGLPHNLIQYWAFLLWLAHKTKRQVGSFVWIGGDIHLYEQHYGMAADIVRVCGHAECRSPQLVYKPTSEDFKADDFSLDGPYNPLILDKVEMVV